MCVEQVLTHLQNKILFKLPLMDRCFLSEESYTEGQSLRQIKVTNFSTDLQEQVAVGRILKS